MKHPDLKYFVFILALLLPVASIAQSENTPPSLAETTKPTISNYRDWTVQCLPPSSAGQKQTCAMVQQLLVKTGERLLAMQITESGTSNTATDPALVAVFSLPLGVYLPTGITVAVDTNKPFSIDYERCDRGGCYAGLVLEKSLTDGLKDGAEMQIRFNNLDGRTISTKLSLKGFTAAYSALIKEIKS